jgi:hypothetical protein
MLPLDILLTKYHELTTWVCRKGRPNLRKHTVHTMHRTGSTEVALITGGVGSEDDEERRLQREQRMVWEAETRGFADAAEAFGQVFFFSHPFSRAPTAGPCGPVNVLSPVILSLRPPSLRALLRRKRCF